MKYKEKLQGSSFILHFLVYLTVKDCFQPKSKSVTAPTLLEETNLAYFASTPVV